MNRRRERSNCVATVARPSGSRNGRGNELAAQLSSRFQRPSSLASPFPGDDFDSRTRVAQRARARVRSNRLAGGYRVHRRDSRRGASSEYRVESICRRAAGSARLEHRLRPRVGLVSRNVRDENRATLFGFTEMRFARGRGGCTNDYSPGSTGRRGWKILVLSHVFPRSLASH